MIFPNFIGQAYRSQSIAVSGDLLVNLYPEVLENSGSNTIVFYGCPGLKLFTTLPTIPVRGFVGLPGSDGGFAVGGTKLYRINQDGTNTLLAGGTSLPGGTTPVSMQTDGSTIVLCVNGQLWVYAIGADTLSQINIALVPGAGMVSYSDGYYIVNVPGTQQFQISSLFNGSTWNALDFAKKIGFPDPIVGQLVDHRDLWLFGGRTFEIWWNSGNANFPWERLQGPFGEAGLAAPLSLAKVDNTHFWLGRDERGQGMIWRANGYTPQRISNFAIEYALSTYTRLDDAIAYAYQELGHTFYVISFPSAFQLPLTQQSPVFTGATWVYDVSNDMWHQREYFKNGISDRVRGQAHAFIWGKHLVGDWQNGNIYEQSVNYFDDAGNRIRRIRRAPHLNKEHNFISYPGLELHIQQGLVPQSGAGSNPVFNLRKSMDGGFTWSNYIQAQAGKVGQYQKRVKWRSLGHARDAAFEISSDEPIQHAWINAYLNPDPVMAAH